MPATSNLIFSHSQSKKKQVELILLLYCINSIYPKCYHATNTEINVLHSFFHAKSSKSGVYFIIFYNLD